MRFRPIKTFINYCGTTVRLGCLDNLIIDFEVTSWAPIPRTMSELERALLFNASKKRSDDFCIIKSSGGVFDHAYIFRNLSRSTFVLTMPYNTEESFVESFDSLMRDYYAEKARFEQEMREYSPQQLRSNIPSWEEQLSISGDIPEYASINAAVVDDRYKVRENGSLAAIIATAEFLEVYGLTRRLSRTS